MANPAIVVDFVANTKDLQKGFNQAQGATSGFGSKLKVLGKVAGAAALGGLVATLKVGIDEFGEASKVAAQTNSVLKSTGNVAGVTADHVNSLAGSLMKKSGVDDEAIQSGENLLLTFTNIRNEAGKGNDVFDQTTRSALDMSVALGTDMKSASMQLGKALNDPIKGVTKLQRSGVTFTESQKAMIKKLQESGKTLDAQKIILGEVNKEFGGSAEAAGKTLPGQINILKQQFSNFAGTLVGEVIPPLTAILKFLMDHKAIMLVMVGVIGTLVGAWGAYTLAMKAWEAMQIIVTAAQWLWNAAISANPIGLIIIAITALIAAGVLLVKNWDTVKAALVDGFNAIWDTVKSVFDWLKTNWPLLLGILTGPLGLAVLAITKNWNTIKDTVSKAVEFVKDTITTGWNAIKDLTSTVFNAIKSTIDGVVSGIKNLFTGLANWITTFASGAWTTALDAVKAVFGVISDAVGSAVQIVKDAFNGLVDFIKGIVDKVKGAAGSVANAIKGPINAIIGAWNDLSFHVPEIKIPSFNTHIPGVGKIGGGTIGGWTVDFPDLPKLARGGVVSSPTLAMVGEGRGREIVAPESLLREIVGQQGLNVRVFIGDTELKGLVDARIDDANTGLARTLLAGGVN